MSWKVDGIVVISVNVYSSVDNSGEDSEYCGQVTDANKLHDESVYDLDGRTNGRTTDGSFSDSGLQSRRRRKP